MKFLILFAAFFTTQSHADWASCVQDAKNYGYRADDAPKSTCFDILKKHPNKIEATSSTGRYQISALGNMLYLDTMSDKQLVKRDVLAGDQTDLRNISQVWIHEKKKRFLVLQSGSPRGLLTYTLEYASNTAPLRHFTSPLLNNVTKVKLLDDRDEIALISSTNQNIKFINSDADTVRYKGGKFVPLLFREIKGEDSKLTDPLDVAISDSRKEIYVLDTGKILVYELPLKADCKPRTEIPLPKDFRQAIALELGAEAGSVTVILKSGKSTKVSVL